MSIEFSEWPKIARLNREIVITEKIDGTNAAVGIRKVGQVASIFDMENFPPLDEQAVQNVVALNEDETATEVFQVYAQSRTRIITPAQDNHGFAAWVKANALGLFNLLGPGLHFGEWWGSGIQRGYGLEKGDKRFSLFNTARHGDKDLSVIPGLGVVPVLYQGPFDGMDSVIPDPFTPPWEYALAVLRGGGSQAAPGFGRPEGVVIYHTAANKCFKVTLENDEVPKEVAAKRAAKLDRNAA